MPSKNLCVKQLILAFLLFQLSFCQIIQAQQNVTAPVKNLRAQTDAQAKADAPTASPSSANSSDIQSIATVAPSKPIEQNNSSISDSTGNTSAATGSQPAVHDSNPTNSQPTLPSAENSTPLIAAAPAPANTVDTTKNTTAAQTAAPSTQSASAGSSAANSSSTATPTANATTTTTTTQSQENKTIPAASETHSNTTAPQNATKPHQNTTAHQNTTKAHENTTALPSKSTAPTANVTVAPQKNTSTLLNSSTITNFNNTYYPLTDPNSLEWKSSLAEIYLQYPNLMTWQVTSAESLFIISSISRILRFNLTDGAGTKATFVVILDPRGRAWLQSVKSWTDSAKFFYLGNPSESGWKQAQGFLHKQHPELNGLTPIVLQYQKGNSSTTYHAQYLTPSNRVGTDIQVNDAGSISIQSYGISKNGLFGGQPTGN